MTRWTGGTPTRVWTTSIMSMRNRWEAPLASSVARHDRSVAHTALLVLDVRRGVVERFAGAGELLSRLARAVDTVPLGVPAEPSQRPVPSRSSCATAVLGGPGRPEPGSGRRSGRGRTLDCEVFSWS